VRVAPPAYGFQYQDSAKVPSLARSIPVRRWLPSEATTLRLLRSTSPSRQKTQEGLATHPFLLRTFPPHPFVRLLSPGLPIHHHLPAVSQPSSPSSSSICSPLRHVDTVEDLTILPRTVSAHPNFDKSKDTSSPWNRPISRGERSARHSSIPRHEH